MQVRQDGGLIDHRGLDLLEGNKQSEPARHFYNLGTLHRSLCGVVKVLRGQNVQIAVRNQLLGFLHTGTYEYRLIMQSTPHAKGLSNRPGEQQPGRGDQVVLRH
jgi:hypothetical protein